MKIRSLPCRLRVTYQRLDKVRPNPRNPRKHSTRQINKLARIIRKQGCNVPLLVDREGNLLAGHARYQACQSLGFTEVPTICLEHLDENQARAFALADNRLGELSEWDEKLLAEQLKELSLVLDFDLELSGFDIGEIDLRIQDLNGEKQGGEESADTLPAAGPRVSQGGEMWLLDENRVLCASALDESAYERLLEQKRAAMVFTDPPYNVPIAGNVSGLGAVHHRNFMMGAGEMDEFEFTAFLRRPCELLVRFSIGGALHFICIDWRHLAELLAAGREVYSELLNLCVWVKNNGGMGSFYRSRHELIFVFKCGPLPPQQYSTRAIRPKPHQRLGISLHYCLRQSRWGRQPPGAAPDRQAGRTRGRRRHGLFGAGRSHPRRFSRQRHDVDCRGTHRTALLWAGTRPNLCRHGCPPLASLYRRTRPT
jgi:ParB-like chromosome segregation protein Spo0J